MTMISAKKCGVTLFMLMSFWAAESYAQAPTANAVIPSKNAVPSKNTQVPTPSVSIPQKVDLYTYLSPVRDGFMFPAISTKKYPDLDISGFYETKISGRNFNPKTPSDSRFQTILRDPIYNKLPRDVLLGDPKLDIRYRFNIDGKLDRDLTVHYDIEQEPDFPGKYDIKIKYKNTDLTFYHFDVDFNDSEFMTVRKSLNGAMVHSYGDEWDATIATGKQRSQATKFAANGSGTTKISLGNRSILEDSLQVWVNNIPQVLGRDYTVNYFQGEITFSSTKGSNDYIVAVYEYTNPIEDFIPLLSRRNFFGSQFLWRPQYKPKDIKFSKHVSDEILKPAGATPNFEFTVKNAPVLIATEYVKINGRTMRQDKDYALKNQRGKIYILNPSLLGKNDQLTISYDYYETEVVEEDLIGKNTPGPYAFSRKYVLDGTVAVSLDNLPMVEAKDYSMDYEKGRIVFNYEVKYPKIISVKYTAVKSATEVVTKNNAPFTAGVTYLTEYAQTQLENQVLAVPTESYTLSTSNVITTKFTPITNTPSIGIIINGIKLQPNQYSVTNAYLGQITVSDNVSAKPWTTAINYSYQKSFRTTFVFPGITGKNGLKYINNTDFTLRDVPVAKGGVAYIRLLNSTQGELILNPGREFNVEYGTDGQTLQISFNTTLENSASILTSYPTSSDRITLVYDYIPAVSPTQGNVTQQVLGLTLGAKLSDQWRVNSEFVVADNNLSKPQTSISFQTPGTGKSNDSYSIGNKNIVENSEEVYLNSRRVNKDTDYIVNYVTGTIRFVNLNPGVNDAIRVNYKIFDSGSTQLGVQHNTKLATKLATQYTGDSVVLKGDFKFIDKDFLPIGTLREAAGSTVYGGSMDWKVDPYNLVNVDYHHRDIFAGGNTATNKSLYRRTDEIISMMDLKGLYRLFDTKQSLRLLIDIQDPDKAVTKDSHLVDEITWDYNGSISFGPEFSKTTILKGLSRKESNFLDKFDYTVVETEKTRVDNKTLFSKMYALGDTTLTPFLELSRAQTDVQVSSASVLAVRNERTYANRTNYGLSSTFLPFSYLPVKVDYSRDEVRSITAKQSTESVNVLSNSIYDVGYNPTSWFNTSTQIRHTESESPLANQKGSLEDYRSYQLSRFTPIGFLGSMGLSESEWFLFPIKGSTLTFGVNESNRRENNNARQFDFNSSRFTFSNLEPLDGFALKSYSFDTQLSTSLSTEGSSTASRNRTSAQSTGQSGSVGITPKWPLLNLFGYTYTFENRSSDSFSDDQAVTITSNRVFSSTPYFKRGQQLSFSPGDIGIQLPFLPKIGLGKITTAFTENYEDKQNYRLAEQYRLSTGVVSTSSVSQDNSLIKSYGFSIGLNPMYIINLSGTAKLGSEWYNRNINTSSKGSIFKDTLDLAVNADMSPFSFLKLDSNATYGTVDQYRSSNLDTTLESLKKSVADQTFANPFIDFLDIRKYTLHGGLTLTPFTFISLTSGADYVRIQQALTTSSNVANSLITQIIGSAGASLSLFSGLSTAYTYSMKFSEEGTGTQSQGYSGVTTVTYVPFQSTGFKVNITYTREDTWGKDLNALDQSAVQQGSGNTIQYQIVERDDVVETAILSVDVNIPITNNPFINSFVVTGEGHIKKVTDRLDSTKTDKRSFDISGVVLKGTLLF